ncbi:DJ-1/PfpI family protein [Bradyrhizobium iriomotense]|uniref:ThiJ family protein n=1 Tax=Bradyrhizobium iriomotense TaxID=441950 RepID=A0ABQ6AYP1_9BRAD|nr:DJ-1/PfpI family protein [Bradyrhizobium iriomotense]GLR84992.1 ThiJ family protein [Bradyrhizobium iriomotense]
MDRREFNTSLAAASLLNLIAPAALAQPAPSARLRVGLLIHSDMILLDLAGPLTAFNMMQVEVHLLAKTEQPVVTDVRLPVAPTATFDKAPRSFDVLFVPGGLKGTIAAMQDTQTVEFIREQGNAARLVTSVCTGSLLLGAAGLLKGYQATSHWYVRDYLAHMGAVVRTDRVVEDRNRMTAGGVTAGIDFALTIAARLSGEETAKRIQLLLEYDPKPPFNCGSPEQAGPALVGDVQKRRQELISEAERVSRAAGVAIKL